jgi:RecA/RadA recombinase
MSRTKDGEACQSIDRKFLLHSAGFSQALDLLAKHRASVHALPTELPALDAALHGGVPTGSITELVGRSGNGKTQMCITLTVSACVSTFLRENLPRSVLAFVSSRVRAISFF